MALKTIKKQIHVNHKSYNLHYVLILIIEDYAIKKINPTQKREYSQQVIDVVHRDILKKYVRIQVALSRSKSE